MKVNDNYLQELTEIRNLMEKSSRFLSLSGLSGISAGIAAMAGAFAAWIYFRSAGIQYDEYYEVLTHHTEGNFLGFLLLDAIIVLLLAVGLGLYFSYRRARKMQLTFWNPASRSMLLHLFIPVVTGGLVCLIMLFRGGVSLVVPMMLVFYGLALISAGKFTQYNINFLGITEILTGILAMIFIRHPLLFWILGFGIWHILYGIIFYYKFEKEDG